MSGGAALTVNGGGELTLADAPFNSDPDSFLNSPRLQIGSVISDDTSAVTVNTIGYVALNASNSFSGGMYINEGSANTSATGTAAAGAFGAPGNNVYIFPGGAAYLRGVTSASVAVTFAQNFFIAGNGAPGTAASQGGYFGVLQFRCRIRRMIRKLFPATSR